MIRVQRSRAAGAKLPEDTLYVGRPTLWGNPWTGPDAVVAYQRFMEHVVSGVLSISTVEFGLNVNKSFEKPIDDWHTLRGMVFALKRLPPKHVACWCGLDKSCHASVIAAIPYLFAWNRSSQEPMTQSRIKSAAESLAQQLMPG